MKGGIFEPLLELNFDGIEAIYSKNTSEQNEFYKGVAREKGLFYTAGSDFHSDRRIDSRHGLIGQVSLNSEEIDNFIIKCLSSNIIN